MGDEAEKKNDVRGFIATYWPIAAALLVIAAEAGANSFQLGNLAEGNKAVLAKLDKLTDKVGDYQADAAAMQATQLAAGATVAELQKRVHDVETRQLRR